jgi:hypothetical protein
VKKGRKNSAASNLSIIPRVGTKDILDTPFESVDNMNAKSSKKF